MKILTIIALLTMTSSPAFADYTGPNASSGEAMTVQEALNAADDTEGFLEGYIINQLGDEKYTFSDNSGTITIDADDDEFPAQNIDENTMVRIYGEVDASNNEPTEFDVEKIEIM